MNYMNPFFLKVSKSLFYFKYKFNQMLRNFFNVDQKTNIGNRKIILPPGHLLSMYISLYEEYDKFLPKIIKNIKQNESIIDIGANVGDTLFRLINSNLNPNYYCIEADDYFFGYLKKNKELLDLNLQNKIVLIKELVGSNLIGNLSQSTTGTKSLVESNTGIKSKTLDEIIIDYKIENIKLIKVDCDGYDYNVVFSAINEIKKNKPDLFFEHMILNEKGYKGYAELIEELFKIGYSNWTVLNNYGSIIFENKSYTDFLRLIKSDIKNKIVLDVYCKWKNKNNKF